MAFSRHKTPCVASIANPYSGSANAIVYAVTKVPDGWKVSATVPEKTSPDDRMKVIDWFHTYRAAVRRSNPFWLANFHVGDSGYVLEIRPTADVRQLVEAGEKVKEIWDDTLKNAER